VGEPAQLLLYLIENDTYFLKALAVGRIDFVGYGTHGQTGGKKELSGLIMHCMGYALNLLFQSFIQPAQGQSGIVVASPSHLVRRKALVEELLCPAQVLNEGR
jgi:hypothetical protein